MEAKNVIAIVRHEVAERVEQRLQEMGIAGICATKVKWYGEYPDFYSRDAMVEYVRLEVFIEAARAEAVAAGIMEAASTGLRGDGIVAIAALDKVYRVRTKTEITGERLWQ